MLVNGQNYLENSSYLISGSANFSKISSKDKVTAQSRVENLNLETMNDNLKEMNTFFNKDRANFTDIASGKEQLLPKNSVAEKTDIPQEEKNISAANKEEKQFDEKKTSLSELSLASSAMSSVIPSPQAQALKTIDILYTSDLHGTIAPEEKKGELKGGLAYVGSVIKDLKGKSEGNSILLDGGDWAQGSYKSGMTKGRTVIDFMNKMGYDAAEVGNHEFDWSKQSLDDMSKDARFPVLGANITREKGNLDEIKPYTIKEINGVKVGVLGLITPQTAEMTKSNNIEGLKFEDAQKTAEKYVAELKEKGTDMVVVLSHQDDDETVNLARSVKGIDVIVNGHTHKTMAEPLNINGTLIVEPGCKGQTVGDLKLEIDPQTKKIVSFNNKIIPVDTGDIKPDPEIEKLINPVIEEANKKKSEVAGTALIDLSHEGKNAKNSVMANVITDSMVESSGCDIGIINTAGIRSDIKKGDVTVGDLYRVLPFESRIIKMDLTGEELRKAMENSAGREGNRLQVSGMTMDVDSSKPSGERVSNIKIQNKPIEEGKIYHIATDEFLSGGGDNYDVFTGGRNKDYGPLVVDGVRDYIKGNSPIDKSSADVRVNYLN